MESAVLMLVQVLVPLGMMAMVVLIVWFTHDSKRKAKERQAEIVSQLIGRFSTGEAFAEAIQGPEGSKLAEALALDAPERKTATWKGLFIPASILTFLGVGFFILAFALDLDHGLLLPAVVIGSVGLALALSTYVMWRVERRNGDGSSNDEGAAIKAMGAFDGTGMDGP